MSNILKKIFSFYFLAKLKVFMEFKKNLNLNPVNELNKPYK